MKHMFSNPVLVKELRRRMRGNRAMILLTIYLSLIGIVTLLIYLAFISSMSMSPDIEDGRDIGRAIFLTVVFAALVQVCIITPSLTAGSIAGEKERQSYDLLITTLLTPWQIILGKIGSALAFLILLILAMLPLAGLAFLFGGVSATELIVAMVVLAVTSVLYASVGIFWSTLMKTTLGAVVRSQASVILLLLGIPFLMIIAAIANVDDIDFLREVMGVHLSVYLIGGILCVHPFFALIMTEVWLFEGENPFFTTIDPSGIDVLVPAPWLAYSFIGVLLTIVLLVLSTHLLEPVQYRPRGVKRKDVPSSPPAPPS